MVGLWGIQSAAARIGSASPERMTNDSRKGNWQTFVARLAAGRVGQFEGD